jgi:hypothetical protein
VQLYNTVEQDFIQSHATPEKAAAFYRELGVDENHLDALTVGTPERRKLELNNRLRLALASLQNARDALRMQ